MDSTSGFDKLIENDISKYINNIDILYCMICHQKLNSCEIGIYASDVVLPERKRSELTIDVIFCGECNPEHIRIPHLGINEINLSVYLDNNYEIKVKDVILNHKSICTNGIVWNPCKVWENIARYPCSEIDESSSAAYISELFYQANIPITNIIKSDGKMDFGNLDKTKLTEKYIKYCKTQRIREDCV